MDENGDDGSRRSARTRAGSGKDIAAAGGLGVAVLGILILGAFLRAQPPAGAPAAGAASSIPVAKPLRAERSDPAPTSSVGKIGEHAPPPVPPAERRTGEPAAPLRELRAVPRGDEAPPAPTPPTTDVETLARRARDDLARRVRLRSPYTAQLAVSCEPPNVERLLRKAGPSPSLYLLPAEVDGRPCFRVCWGSYASAREASAATDLPAVLREEVDRPVPKAIAEVLP